jgi:nicotinate-nucleotide pyrophosphorylase (carboxylating)
VKDIEPTQKEIDAAIGIALEEDAGGGDVTSEALIPSGLSGKASILVKEKGVLAGIDVAARAFKLTDPSLKIKILIKDGTSIQPGDIAAVITGSVKSLLKAERTALNFLQRMSGIASLAARYAAELKGYSAKVYDTRKTTPGLRVLEKYAVRMGGGQNHRRNLGDAVLIKDNHIAALRATGMNLEQIINKAREKAPRGMTIEAEVTNLAETAEAIKAGADIIMLDNMSAGDMKRAVDMVAGRAKVEASGNITLDNLRETAATGVDIISIGALTHSYKALDISLEMDTQTLKLV